MNADEVKNLISESDQSVRLAFEVSSFTKAVLEQEKNFNRILTEGEILRAWATWKLERFTYIDTARLHNQITTDRLYNLAISWLKQNEPGLDETEAERFSRSYAVKLEDLTIEPLSEHILTSWTAWKNGQRW